jgi:hypothetical protein
VSQDLEPSSLSDFNLARAIVRHGAPNVARHLLDLTLASEDPEDYRKYLELLQKLEGKDQAAGGAPVQITIDLGGATPAVELVPSEPEVIEASPAAEPAPAPTPALPAPTDEDDAPVFDLSALLGDS